MSGALFLLVLIGFSQTYFLRFLHLGSFADSPQESFFYLFHGVSYTLWFLILILQILFIRFRFNRFHTLLGWASCIIASLLVFLGVVGVDIAVSRLGGFFHGPPDPLAFSIHPLSDLVQFILFFLIAIFYRSSRLLHSRFVLFASISLLHPALARLPFPNFQQLEPFPGYPMADLEIITFPIFFLLFDLFTLQRIRGSTYFFGFVIYSVVIYRPLIAATPLWHACASWIVSFVNLS